MAEKEVHPAVLPYQVRLNNPQDRQGSGRDPSEKANGERDPSSLTLPWPRRPALEFTEEKRKQKRRRTEEKRNRREEEQKRRGLGREVDCGRSVTKQWLQPNILPQGCRSLKISSSASLATLSHTNWWFVLSKSSGDHQRVVWIQSFPLPEHPPVTSRLAAGIKKVKSSMAKSLKLENLLPQNVGSIINYFQ